MKKYLIKILMIVILAILVHIDASGQGDSHENSRSNPMSANWYTLPYELVPGQWLTVHPNCRQHGHNGVDLNSHPSDFDDENNECVLDSDVGLPLVAPADGIVRTVIDTTCCRRLPDTCDNYIHWRSNCLWIEHADDEWSAFYHIAQGTAMVSPGDVVTAGQPVALEGEVGAASGVHLHWAVYYGYQGSGDFMNDPVEPADFRGQRIPLVCSVVGNIMVPGHRYVLLEDFNPLTDDGIVGDPCGTYGTDDLANSDDGAERHAPFVMQAAVGVGASNTVIHPSTVVDTCGSDVCDSYSHLFCTSEGCRNNGGSVVYRAGARVTLTSGFWAKAGSFFRAEIGSPN